MAVQLLQAFKDEIPTSYQYWKTMRKYGIRSRSWGFVGVNIADIKGLKKLNIIKVLKSSRLPSSNLRELVKNRYIIGLEKYDEYKIWKTIMKISVVSQEEAKKIADAKKDLVKHQVLFCNLNII